MKFLRYFILITLSFFGFTGLAQYTFFADTLYGCDSLRVNFEFRNLDPGTPVTSVEWDFGNEQTGTGQGVQNVLYDTPGSYTVSILVNNTTSKTNQDLIKVHATPTAGFFWTDSLELGSYAVSFINAPQAVDTIVFEYDWQFQDGGTGNTRTLIHRFQETGDYRASLMVTHPAGCKAQWMDIVTVKDSLYCQNVFTPNDDGVNDFFVVGSNGVTVYSIQIFSRSGAQVYKAEAPTLIWDGRNLSGQELLPGTYYYIIRSANGSGRFEKTGFVEMYR